MNLLPAVAVLALVTLGNPSRAATPGATNAAGSTEARFSLVLEKTEDGWAAQCDSGCTWTRLSMNCLGCEVRITDAGVGPARLAHTDSRRFAFTLESTNRGWTAKGVRGVRWAALSWKCGTAACRARVDEAGVAGF